MTNKIVLLSYITKVLSVLNMWTKKHSKLNHLKAFATVFYCLLSQVGQVGYVIYYIGNFGFNYKELSTLISAIPSVAFTLFVQTYFYIKHQDLKALLHDIGDFTSFPMSPTIGKLNTKLNRMAKAIIYFWMLPSFIVVFIFITSNKFTFTKCPDNIPSDCGLITGTALPFNIFFTPARQIVMIIEDAGAVIMGTSTLYIVILTTSMSDIIVYRIIHLKSLVIEIKYINNPWSRREHLKMCIRYHQQIIGFSTRLSNFSETLFLGYVAVTALILSSIACEIILRLEYSSLWHAILYLIPLHLSSSAGEHLFEHSTTLSEAIYESVPWDGDLEIQKDMLFFITRTNKALTLRIGKFTAYNRPVMLSIMKLWYSVFTLLLKTL